MSSITDWKNTELYPSLFERIDTVFPEHSFKRYRGGWRSATYLSGAPHKQQDKTVITTKVPGSIFEQGGERLSLIDYVMRRDGLEFIDAVRLLAEKAGLQMPDSSSFDPEAYQRKKDRESLLEEANSYFLWCLRETEKNPGAETVKAHLAVRKYTSEDIAVMELGYIPSQERLFKYLLSKGYSQGLIDDTIKLNQAIGTSHQLTIPYRSGGVIRGFIFRTTGPEEPKYLNSTGLERSKTFFNIKPAKGDKDLIIVEGWLDALIADARGVNNVVALGGTNISKDQIEHAKRNGAKRFTLCLDNDEAGKKATLKAIDTLLEEGIEPYVMTLPELGEGKTDPDRLIKEKGVESFKTAVKEALSYWAYWLEITGEKYVEIQEREGRMLTYKEVKDFEEEVVKNGARIKSPVDRDVYLNNLLSHPDINVLGITKESLSIAVDRLTSTKEKEDQAKELRGVLSKASELQAKGDTEGALELLDNKIKEVRLKDKATEFNSLLLPIKEEALRERISNRPESIRSGYTIGGEELLLPSGAISIFAAPTSHGKTTFLINLALNVTQAHPDKETYLFSYEEDGDSVLINTLNTYLDEEISTNNRRTLKSYFTTGSTDYIKRDSRGSFTPNKDKFFRDLIDSRRLNIHYTNYNSDTLIDAIRYLHKNANPGAIFIDYIQLLNLPEGKYKTYSRQEEIKEICIALKDIAVETGLPIILGAQFNREVINPLKLHATKIGEAGDIERIANLIVGFWNNNFKPMATDGELRDINEKGALNNADTLFTTILKNRGGRVGLEELLSFNGNTGKIKNNGNRAGVNPF
jgi:DNA primase catalytic core